MYVGQQPEGPLRKSNSPKEVVGRLCKPLFGSGRNVTLDNWFTSVDLVQSLLEVPYVRTVGIYHKHRKTSEIKYVCLQAKIHFGFLHTQETEMRSSHFEYAS